MDISYGRIVCQSTHLPILFSVNYYTIPEIRNFFVKISESVTEHRGKQIHTFLKSINAKWTWTASARIGAHFTDSKHIPPSIPCIYIYIYLYIYIYIYIYLFIYLYK